MKKQILLYFAVLSFFAVEAQVINDGGLEGVLMEVKHSESLDKVQGSPYLNEEFQHGMVIMEGKQPLRVFLRYNVEDEIVEIKTDLDEEKTYSLSRGQKAEYSIGNDKLVYDKIRHEGETITGYFKEHYSGENVRLLEKPTASVSKAVAAKSSYESDKPARISIDSEYYIVRDGEVENVRLKHRDIKKAFDSREAKNYLSDNRIRSIEDLVQFVTFLDNN